MSSPDEPTNDRPSPPPTAESDAAREVEYPAFRRLTFWSVLGGLCPLIPLPFVDDWALAAVQRRMVRDLAARKGAALDAEAAKILTGGGEGWQLPGCLGIFAWVLRKVVFKILKKLFRTVLYFFAIRDGIVRATETFHEGYLVLHAARRGELGRSPKEAWSVRAAMVAALAEIDLNPIREIIARAFRGSVALLVKASRVLGKAFGRRRKAAEPETAAEAEALEKEEEILGSFVDRLARSLWGNREHFARLETAFERQLAAPVATPAPGPSAGSTPA